MKVKFLILKMLAISLLSLTYGGCGGSSESDSANPVIKINRGGWVEIDSYHISPDDTGKGYAYLSGIAFTSRDYTAHRCYGFCCLMCLFDDSYPGVDVSWNNQTNGKTGEANSRYGTLTSWEHEWDAIIPLIDGSNIIEVTAQDPAGKSGSTSITVQNIPDTIPSTVSSTNHRDINDNIPVNIVISAFFSEEMDKSTITTSTFTLSDISKNYVSDTITYGSQMATFTPLSDLSPKSTYFATITNEVKDLGGVALADDYIWSFTTSWSKTPVTGKATDITSTTAHLNGSIQNPEGETTTAWFEYRLTPSYGFSTSPEIFPFSGTYTVSIEISGLQDCTTYYYRIVTENSEGLFYGDEKAFITYVTSQIQILASGLNAPVDIQLDAANVYWVEIYGDAVKKVPINGGQATIVASSEMWGNQASLAIDATHIYWADWKTIWMSELVGGTVTILASGQNDIMFLQVYSTDLYFSSDNGIEKVDLETGIISTLVQAENPLDFNGGFVVDATGIYILNWIEGTIWKSTLDGEQIIILAAGLNKPHSPLLDSGLLFWAENEAISQMSTNGGTITTVISDIAPYQIAKDDTHVYWTDYYGETVNGVDLDSGTVTTIAEMQERPISLTTDANSVYWICGGSIYEPQLGSVKKGPKICN